MQFTEKPIRVK